MSAKNSLELAAKLLACFLVVFLIIFSLAVLFEDKGTFVATLAVAQATAFSFLFFCASAAVVLFVGWVLLRQPDEVLPDETGRGRVYRERIRDSIVYTNTGAVSGPAMIIHPSDQEPPRVRVEPEAASQAFWQRLQAMPDTLEVFDGSLEEFFAKNRGNGG